ncbi:MAG: ABC transporter permease [Anaerolineaceae bacterium]|nr:ABC transporter permease [Anaerolineaceae bacterium]
MTAPRKGAFIKAAPALQDEVRQSQGLWRDALRRLFHNKLAVFGALFILLVIFMGIFGPSLVSFDPDGMDFTAMLSGPTQKHWMGTDEFGRDIFTRVVYGARISLMVGIVAVSISTIAGTLLGMIAGFSHRRIDEVIMRAMDVLYAFPFLLLAIAIVAVLGRGFLNVMIALGVVYTPIFARIARAAVLGVRNEEFIQAARALGAGEVRIIFNHITPNILSPIIVEITLSLAFAILAEASLSFFALGVQPPTPSWGRMLAEGRDYLHQSAWLPIFPGLAIMLTVLAFNFLGDGLREALDPRQRR